MAAIRPFCALRYDPQAVGDLSRVIAPPYDVIGPDEQEQLYQASPCNIVRLTLGRQASTDAPADNRYTRARRDYETWRTNGTLQRDLRPALYVMEQAYGGLDDRCRRLGFTALLELGQAGPQHLYRHEATLAAPKEDRTKLLEAVPANLEPIFCVYPDSARTVQALLEDVTTQRAPDACATLQGEDIRVWLLTDPARIEPVTAHLGSVAALIADGHHRFEVAYAHRSRYHAVMSYFVSMADPSLLIRPIHRVVPGVPADLHALRALCLLEPAADLPSLSAWLAEQSDEGRFGYVDGATLYHAVVKPEPLARWLMTPSVPRPIAALDVSILHGLVLPHLGINGTEVRYSADAAHAMGQVRQGQGGCAWLLRPIPLRQVYALASQGFTLPPKSTYFYPKVPSGITVNPWD